jgi:hypothetical protein
MMTTMTMMTMMTMMMMMAPSPHTQWKHVLQ